MPSLSSENSYLSLVMKISDERFQNYKKNGDEAGIFFKRREKANSLLLRIIKFEIGEHKKQIICEYKYRRKS